MLDPLEGIDDCGVSRLSGGAAIGGAGLSIGLTSSTSQTGTFVLERK